MKIRDPSPGQDRSRQRSNPWPDLVVAILSVNNHPLEKTFSIHQDLDSNGLFDPRNIASWDQKEIVRRLKASGYDRGDTLNAMFAARILSLRSLTANVDVSEAVLASGSRAEVAELLSRVNGVGPTVLDNFLLMRG
jgi:3-methyladenine DNA glycosylase/8-oxoguanine DNA glycosylase